MQWKIIETGYFLQPALLRRDPTHVFSCEICDIFKNTYFEESFQEYLFCRKPPIESFLSRDIYVVVFFTENFMAIAFSFFCID